MRATVPMLVVVTLASSMHVSSMRATARSTAVVDSFTVQLLKNLRARRIDCPREIDAFTVRYCGASLYDAQTVRDKTDDLLRSTATEDIAVSDWEWNVWERQSSLRVMVDDIAVVVSYDESTGDVSVSFDKPLAECDGEPRSKSYAERVVITPGHGYPELARVARITAVVELEVHVGPGASRPEICFRSVSRPNLGFEHAAIEFIRREWAASKAAGRYSVAISFELPESGSPER